MPRSLSALKVVLCFASAQFMAVAVHAQPATNPEAEIQKLAPQALSIIKNWQPGNTKPVQRTVHLIYWTPADLEPSPRYQERLTAIMLDIQSFYAKEMERLGFGPMTISLDLDADKQVHVILVKGKQPYAHYKTESGQEIRQECLPALREAGLNPEQATIIIFNNMANWDPAQRRITQNSPYYASGNTVSGTAWQVDSPILELASLTNKTDFVQDGQYGRITLGKYNSIFIGGIAHEMGHALGLPHNAERPNERALWGSALMGSGNRTYGADRRGDGKGSFLTLASGLRLVAHPLFCNLAPLKPIANSFKFDGIQFTTGDKFFTCSGRVTSEVPVYAVLGYIDPQGNSNYDALPCVAVPDKDGRFTLNASPLTPKQKGAFRLIALGADGSASSFASPGTTDSYPYRVTADGQPDLTMTQLRLDLAPAVEAVNRKDASALATALKKLSPKYQKFPLFNELSNSLTTAIQPPAPLEATTVTGAELSLTRLRPLQASVGWLRPTYDFIPGPEVLLSSDGELYAHGIYAHAPAKHSYALGGRWQTFSGKAGLAEGNEGSVVFVVEGDGRELWRSPLVKAGNLQSFQIPVKDVQQLLLRVEDGGDGNRNDWGLWLNPVLSRP